MEESSNSPTSDNGLIVNLNVVIEGEPTSISPAKRTPEGEYFLSNLDGGPFMIHTVYFFNKTLEYELDAAKIIREGLANVLVYYYPLAGRVALNEKNRFIINCTGEGALFVEAKADCTLEEINDFMKPDSVSLEKLVYDINGVKNPPLLVAQVTKFKCGGFCLGLSMDHIIFDGIGAMEFMNSWGEVTRGLSISNPPFLDRTLLKAGIPPNVKFAHFFEQIIDRSNTLALLEKEMHVKKSFVFHMEKLEQLKKIAMEDEVLEKCTTFETLAGFMWRAQIKSLRLHPDQQVRVLFTVDGRSKLDPPLPKGFFGNAAMLMSCQSSARKILDNPLSSTVQKIQEKIKMVTDDYIRSRIDYFEEQHERKPLTYTIFLNAWSSLAFHGVDFGWGGPIYSGPLHVARNMVLFLPHGKERRDINLFRGLPASAMKIFEVLIDI
ncbi:omega-hydroxypalmitate O-feruloyl transferase-like [Papaver somniferum]|uniref:omega-hydroxypalmitate O-feruloyl transferase-like n=1 Tax=Papaver somniferum TaxID=3469 RepID=UPI000E6FADA7|nr:omega-hydroxypalmitate O-feruloyl transferase-like [Papaver somniferum]